MKVELEREEIGALLELVSFYAHADCPTPLAGAFSALRSAIQKKEPKKRKPVSMPPIPDHLDSPRFRAAWDDFLAHRKEKRKPVTSRAAKIIFDRMLESKADESEAVHALRRSIESGWTGVFPRPPHERQVATIRETAPEAREPSNSALLNAAAVAIRDTIASTSPAREKIAHERFDRVKWLLKMDSLPPRDKRHLLVNELMEMAS